MSTSTQGSRDLVFTRTFEAPTSLVWQAWTRPEHLRQWWGPHEFTNPRCEIDLRPGGAMRIDMRGPDGMVYPMTGTFIEIDEPRRLVFDSAALGADGKPALEVRSIVTFTEDGKRTRMEVREQILRATDEGRGFAEGMEAGWTQSFERLSRTIGNLTGRTGLMLLDREVAYTREFEAPRETVWKALTESGRIEKWWGPRGFSTRTEKMDVRPGGSWVFDMIGPDGQVYPNHIVYDEVEAPSRLTYRHVEKPEEDTCFFRTIATLEPVEGSSTRTRLTFRMQFESPEMLSTLDRECGAIEGGKQTLARLGEFLSPKSGPQGDEPFMIQRVVDAPLSLVWQAWTAQEHLKAWFGPKGMPIFQCSLDFRVGGRFHYGMKAGDGAMWGLWVFREIVPEDHFAFVSSFSDEAGGVTRAPFSEEWPLESLSTVSFARHAGYGGGTVVTVSSTPLNASKAERKLFNDFFGSMQQGWSGTFEQLDAYVSSQQS